MNESTEKHTEQLAYELLLDVGIQRTSQAYRYLGCALLLVLGGAPLGPELWEHIAQKYGTRTTNVQASCRRGIQHAYRNNPEAFCTALDDVYFMPPKTRDFIAAASRWLRQHGLE